MHSLAFLLFYVADSLSVLSLRMKGTIVSNNFLGEWDWGGGGGGGCVSSYSFCFFLRLWNFILFVFFLVFFVAGSFNRELQVHRNCYVCCVNKIGYLIIFLLEKGKCFDFDHSLRILPYSIHHHHQTFRLSLSFPLADLLSQFILLSCFNAGSPLRESCLGVEVCSKLKNPNYVFVHQKYFNIYIL